VSDADAPPRRPRHRRGFTARDGVAGERAVIVGKAIDGFAPLGPYLVTTDQIDRTS
jgi:2-keto-4-pentenoate hydratase/2-oxohepta-3-ene-1,7-dioic acid hydratase in catechol pathway